VPCRTPLPRALADLIAGFIDIKPAEKQAILETFDLVKRLDEVLGLLAHRIEVLRLSREIEERTKASMDDRQRKFMLREQMQSIQKSWAKPRAMQRDRRLGKRSPRRARRGGNGAKGIEAPARTSDASAEY
jgi:ATP-dependent Lon protease